jgi:hypothetical protein
MMIYNVLDQFFGELARVGGQEDSFGDEIRIVKHALCLTAGFFGEAQKILGRSAKDATTRTKIRTTQADGATA